MLVDYTHACCVAQVKGGLNGCPKFRGHYISRFAVSFINKLNLIALSLLLDELDSIEMIHIPGKAPLVREELNKQALLYKDVGVEPPVGIIS